jgi:hypothetical protein
MSTTAIPRGPRTIPRARAFDREHDDAIERLNGKREEQYDLLTAALIGVAIGVGTTLLLRRGPSGGRPLAPMLRRAALGARWAGANAARLGLRGASWARDAGSELWDRIPRDEIREHVRDYVHTAHERIDDMVDSELHDLRKALRRQRKRLGI